MTLEIALALLFFTGNALILGYAHMAQAWRPIAVFYVLWILAVCILPTGGPLWFVLAVWTAVALRSGRLLVRMQDRQVAR